MDALRCDGLLLNGDGGVLQDNQSGASDEQHDGRNRQTAERRDRFK